MDFVNKQIEKSIAHVRKLERALKNATISPIWIIFIDCAND